MDDRTITPELVLRAFRAGAFPMAEGPDDPGVDWVQPYERAILPLEGLHVSRSLARTVRRGVFELRHDTAFEAVIRGCAAPRVGEPGTWISEAIIQAYVTLHQRGHTHSVEAWRDGRLAGGLYGVHMGGVFFAESMFHDPLIGTDASKVCVVHLVAHLRSRGFVLLDVQMTTPATLTMGAVEIPHAEFMRRLREAVRMPVTF